MNRFALKILFSLLVLLLSVNKVVAQLLSSDSTLSVSGFVEAYYVYDFDRPENNERPPFLYNYTRTNEVSLNLAFVKLQYAAERVRGNLALMTATYAQANLAAEPPIWHNVYEVNCGIRLSQSANVWIDAGVFPSHIGFESAIGKDNWTLTRSILAENSPYYETGAKVTYTNSENSLTLAGLILNGWQRIQQPDGHSSHCWGTQATYQPTEDVVLNYSTFIGNTKPDSITQLRFFHNFYGIFSISSSLGVILGFDLGTEEKSENVSGFNTWFSPVAILQYRFMENVRAALRAEYYQDKNGVIISTNAPNGFQVFGGSVNLDYSITKNSLWRVEARYLQSRDRIFGTANDLQDTNVSLATSLSVFF